MTQLTTRNMQLINTYLSLVPNAYKVGERRLVFDRVNLMSNADLTEFLERKIGDVQVTHNNVGSNTTITNPRVCELF